MKKQITALLCALHLMNMPVFAAGSGIADFEAVLTEKTFEESMKQKLTDTYTVLEEHYDDVYAYKKIDIEDESKRIIKMKGFFSAGAENGDMVHSSNHSNLPFRLQPMDFRRELYFFVFQRSFHSFHSFPGVSTSPRTAR